MQMLNGEWRLATDLENRGCAEHWFASARDEAIDGPVFRHAVETLALVRSLDPT